MKKLLKNTLSAVMILSVLLGTFAGCGKKNETAPKESETTSKTEAAAEEVTESAEDTDEYIPPVEVAEKEIYQLIGHDISDCAEFYNTIHVDGGYAHTNNDCNGYAVSTLSDDDKGEIKAIYITGYGKYVMNDIYTGKKYSDLSERVSGLSDISYDASSLAYACSLKEKINGKNVTVWLYFNDPEGRCTGAIITTEKLKGTAVTTKAKSGKFLYQFQGLPCGELFDAYPEYYNKKLFGILNSSEPGIDACVILDKNTLTYSPDEFRETVACSISYDNTLSGDEDKTVNFNELEIVPGINIGDSRDSVMKQKYSFDGDRLLVRIGANCLEIPMIFVNQKLDSVGYSMFI